MDARHGTPGTEVCTAKHGLGKRWLTRWVDAEGRERSRSFDKRADAEREKRTRTVDLETGTYVDPRRAAVTFDAMAEAWLMTKRAANRAPKTVAGYEEILNNVILPKWGNAKLANITHEQMQAWFVWLSTNPEARQHKRKSDPDAGLSPARVVQVHNIVSQIFDYAIRARYISVNPAHGITLPRKPKSKDVVLTHEQIARLAEETAAAAVRHRSDSRVSPAPLGTLVRFLAYSGLRWSEAVALRVGDVDTRRRRVLVSKAITQVRGQGRIEGDTKTHQRRSAPILTAALNTELAELVRGRDAAEYLFPGPDGGPMAVGYLRVRFDKATAKLGLDGVTPHTLRHSAGSLALAAGASVVTVQKLLGHLNATTTMNVYSHQLPDDFDNLAAAMEQAISPSA
ncbi:MAG: tyrosine-type recombinase/integrase [Mycobacterium sp.]|nr:tyrosine-type recombinase/integrase [Mycobacterium sp.]